MPTKISPLEWKKLNETCQRPDLISYVCLESRLGWLRFIVELEHTYFRPGTKLNEDFSLALSAWPDKEYTFGIVIIPKSHKEQAEELVVKSSLKVCVPGYAFGAINLMPNVTAIGLVPITGEGLLSETFKKPAKLFPVISPNTYFLESAKDSVQYSNDSEKIQTARKEEIAYARTFEDATKEWLKTPEGKAIFDAYTATKPKGFTCGGDLV